MWLPAVAVRAAASAGSARAVGGYAISGGQSTLVLRWDGTRWAQVPSPTSGAQNGQLLGVAAGPASGFWAVGYFVATIPQVDTLAGQMAVGHDIQFFSLDLTNTCWTRSIDSAAGVVLVLCQTNDLELEQYEPVLRAICASLTVEEE